MICQFDKLLAYRIYEVHFAPVTSVLLSFSSFTHGVNKPGPYTLTMLSREEINYCFPNESLHSLHLLEMQQRQH